MKDQAAKDMDGPQPDQTPNRGKGIEDFVKVRRVSNHTEVNLWVVVDRHVDLLLRLGRPLVALGRVVVGDRLHGLFDELVAFVFEALAVTVFSGVDTATVVVVLGSRRRRSVAISRDDVVDAQLLADFFDAQMKGVGFELLACHVGENGSRETHEASSLVLGDVAPSTALLASARTIGLGARLRVATALQVSVDGDGRCLFLLIAIHPTAAPQGDVVRSGDALVSPRHFGGAVVEISDFQDTLN
jgi:hypothetical protein